MHDEKTEEELEGLKERVRAMLGAANVTNDEAIAILSMLLADTALNVCRGDKGKAVKEGRGYGDYIAKILKASTVVRLN